MTAFSQAAELVRVRADVGVEVLLPLLRHIRRRLDRLIFELGRTERDDAEITWRQIVVGVPWDRDLKGKIVENIRHFVLLLVKSCGLVVAEGSVLRLMDERVRGTCALLAILLLLCVNSLLT